MPEPETHALANDLSALDIQSGSEAVDSRLNVAQMLSLIDSILPFEACLYHEIIPLSVESSCLHLGVVNPSDTVATEYARKQVSFIHCSVKSWPVTSDWQRKMLSKYLSYASRQKARPQPQIEAPPHTQNQGDEFLTFIVDSPEDLHSDRPAPTPSRPTAPPPAPVEPPPVVKPPPVVEPESQPLALALDPILSQVPLDQLHRLSPPKLTQALLYQILTEGIGRLYIERRPAHGQVLWSRDGVVQAALKNLSLDQVQSIINELKRLTHLPLLPTAQPKNADIERLYKGERVLLRLRLMAGSHGEEATLQVLRGAALKFYQQQQIKQMGEDALGVAQTLQKRIFEIRQRARQSLTIETPSARTLEALSQMLKTMEEQLEQIMQASLEPNSEKLP
ncbi:MULTISPECIES: hypothetical protein [Cyanophyceae]|uniref:hypothetical protein n=1 Tax=Cyanophyceae TaxID=3028117 RepID=UPI001688DFD9|nr:MULTISPECIES: hypothetical protein [Cyanophyceae]MBD1915919.1 hypothetical protein [Phormidium sp. FACHB-77]MBD2030407.1 hypothetical protein [Phormidium sp. FACHB-322]MBD2053409.1 hypothetical protein [Leptolyngbya sp. FACHB-60]